MSTPESFQVAGVDGCKAGWCVAIACVIDDGSRPNANCALDLKSYFVAGTFSKVLAETNDCALVCVDIPIGLSNNQNLRQCDVEARKLLSRLRASSVFPPPIRPCLVTNDYPTANAISRKLSGKGLSKQSFFLLEKIRQVDDLMTPELQLRVREIHPEISFWSLNSKKPMPHTKKSNSGLSSRMKLLSLVFSDLKEIIAEAPKPKEVAPDDILDALVAAWTAAQVVMGNAKTLPESPEVDSEGLRMEILCPAPI